MASVTYFPARTIIEITPMLLAQVKQAAALEPLRRARLCLHSGPEDRLHEMVIAFCRDGYVRPHRHRAKSESFHMIEGELDVVFFDDVGCVTRRIAMGPVGSGRTLLYRLASEEWHTVVLRTQTAVVHETTNGPFNSEDNEVAPWSPETTDQAAVIEFMQRLTA
jgi:cupin fold WbuC family metalloprotein